MLRYYSTGPSYRGASSVRQRWSEMATAWGIDPIDWSTSSHSHSISSSYPNVYTVDTNTYVYSYETYGRKSGKATTRVEKKPKMSRQDQIDKEVAEALEVPRREAEVKRRVELATKIGADTYPDGSVLKWTRKFGEKDYTYAALKTGGKWYVTGSQMTRASGWEWDDLVQWMVQGENTVENLVVGSGWSLLVA